MVYNVPEKRVMMFTEAEVKLWKEYQRDWPKFAREVLGVYLDEDQEAILRSVQTNKRTSVASGTARGKDFVAAVACMCFLYLMPALDTKTGEMTSTKVAMTAPTDRQVQNIMVPEIARIFNRAQKEHPLPGARLVSYDIRTKYQDWFLTGFKADHHSTEAWTGLHAVNIMFVVTEASGMPDLVFDAIEGNLQNNSRILVVFNPNTSVGYAARSQASSNWNRFQLSSLTAPNVKEKRIIIPGQVDYDWVLDKVRTWATPIKERDVKAEEDDFEFEGHWYRPEDRFRVKILGKFPKVPNDILIPPQWYDLAVQRWKDFYAQEHPVLSSNLTVGLDVAGMGRDSSVFVYRYEDIVSHIEAFNSGGEADHMKLAGIASVDLGNYPKARYKIDTIGEGAGVYSRLDELEWNNEHKRVYSAKFSEKAANAGGTPLRDITGQHTFVNMRAYCYWALRDWLNPANNTGAALPENENLRIGLSSIKWFFGSDGRIQLEPKKDIIERLRRSPDEEDGLALTFYPDNVAYDLEHVEAEDKNALGFY